VNSLHSVIRRGLVIPVPTGFGFGGEVAVFEGDVTREGRAAEGSFLGEGVGGKTDGSLALNCLTGVLGRTGLARTGRTLRVVEGLWSSGNASKFNRRRTSYPRQPRPKESHFKKACVVNMSFGRVFSTWMLRGVNPPGVTLMR
jgi:hypothetical protein